MIESFKDQDINTAIDHACRIDGQVFKVFVLLLACLAVIASFCRLVFRLQQETRLQLDDWLVLFSTVCLITGTAILYHSIRMLYFIDAALLKPLVHSSVEKQDGELWHTWGSITPSWIESYLTLAWVTIFSIKGSFLVLFHRMVQNVRRPLRVYFWVTCSATALSGIVVIILPFALCPHSGSSSLKCFKGNKWVFSISTGVACQLLDIVTDLMIISIPIALLRMSQLRFDHKLRIAMVLCLSLLCIILSVVRLAGGVHTNVGGNRQFSLVWNSFMLQCEAAIAVITGSVPALRAIYRTHQKRRTLYGTENGEMSVPLSAKIKSAINLSSKSPIKLPSEKCGSSDPKTLLSLPTFQLPPLKTLKRQNSLLKPSRRRANHESLPSEPSIAPLEEAHLEPQREEQNHIRITVECSVMSEAASLHEFEEFSEVGNREWVWGDERGPWNSQDGLQSEVTGPPPAIRTDRTDIINTVDPALLGTIMSGVRI